MIGFIPFPRVLVLCEMQSVSSRFELVTPCPFLQVRNIVIGMVGFFVPLFNGISTFVCYLMPKLLLEKRSSSIGAVLVV